MRFDSRLFAAALILLCASMPVLAQEATVPEHLLGMVGDWRLEQEDQALPTCGLKFTEDKTDFGWTIELPEPCPAPFPPAASFTSWNVDEDDGSVLILDAGGAVALRLLEGEDGLFVTPEGELPAFYLMLPWDEDGTGGEAGDEF
jgi:hypothetical protein